MPIRMLSGLLFAGCFLLVASTAEPQEAAKPAVDPAAAKAEEAKFQSVKSPVPYSAKSIARGKMMYQRFCTECHGKDGKA